MTSESGAIVERAHRALLDLAAERTWPDVTLRDIAARAGVELADLYEEAQSKGALLASLSARLDRTALAAAPTEGEVHDRLFDTVMARVEAMEPEREALIAIARFEGPFGLAAHLPRTARAILEGAGIEATPLRLVAMTALWARTAQVWRDDEGGLNRTMAEIDLRLRAMRRRLTRLGAGF